MAWLQGGRRRVFASGLLASLAIFLRYQNGIIAAGLVIALLASGRRRDAIMFGAGGLVGLLGGELLDWITWGQPFHSLFAYLQYNLIQGKAAEYGVSPWSYYFQTAWSSTGLSCLVIAVGIVAAWRRARALVTVALAFVAFHCFVQHKEFRFLMPVVPLLLALSAVGLQSLLAQLQRAIASSRSDAPDQRRKRLLQLPPTVLRNYGAAAVLGILTSALMVGKTVDATLASTGQWSGQAEGADSVWHHLEGANLGLAEAGKQNDLCGVLLGGLGAVWSGGFSYLHRDVPFLTFEQAPHPGDLLPFANYVVLAPGVPPPPEYVALGDFRGWAVSRRAGGCLPPPRELTRLFEDRPRP